MSSEKRPTVVIFWFRRDLRIDDNTGLYHALKSGFDVLPVFIFDRNILDDLSSPEDRRVAFIYREVVSLKKTLEHRYHSTLRILHTTPAEAFDTLHKEYDVKGVYANEDYEPYAIQRDQEIEESLGHHCIAFNRYKDHVIFARDEILKQDGGPYTKFTPYSRKWLDRLSGTNIQFAEIDGAASAFYNGHLAELPKLKDLGFAHTDLNDIPDRQVTDAQLRQYAATRNFPAKNGTSGLGVHLRFGTMSIRRLVMQARQHNPVFLNELIWREFFQQIIWHFPEVVHQSFKPKYDAIAWRNHRDEFDAWCAGKTGYPLVDAGMRELNATGYMHNRVRMVVASFLTKDLLIDWRWGEAWFAEKLMDYELASNNGNWQWAAGTGCDAAPYFRIFNPKTQQEKFDPDGTYIREWVPEYGKSDYPMPIVDHKEARKKALDAYAKAVK